MPAAPGHADADAQQQETEQQEIGQHQAEQHQEAAASWRALGTLVHLVVTEPSCLPAARSLLEADLAAVDLACSRFRADSEICTLQTTGPTTGQTTGQTTGPTTGQTKGHAQGQQVSPLLAEAIAVALRAAELTDGDVDPTVGAAMSAIGYDRDFERIDRTGPAAPLTVRTVPGWREVRLEGRTLTMPAGVQLDLGATAKAWAADRSAARIARQAGCGVLVSLGGDIAVAGPAPEGGWRIRVQDVTGAPDETPEGPYALIAIRDGGLATSSTKARRWQRGGDVLHHILDPRTGLPAEPVWRTVSVAAGTCADANAASTAAVIRGRAALGWLARLGLPARLVDASGVVFTVAGWPQETPQETPQERREETPPGNAPGKAPGTPQEKRQETPQEPQSELSQK
jgi:thiamine biosynthesis lipoprotein ApbE